MIELLQRATCVRALRCFKVKIYRAIYLLYTSKSMKVLSDLKPFDPLQ